MSTWDSFSQWLQKPNQPDPISHFVLLTGDTQNSHQDFIDRLNKQVRLQQVFTVAQCDFILVFCPVVSRAGTDIEAAVKKLNNESVTKPAVLVVLHHTCDPESVVPDSSRAVHRENTVTVDCLFHKDKRLLQCHKNDESLSITLAYINPQISNVFVLVTGNTLNSHKDFIDRLKRQVRLQEVSTVAACDFILVFCPVVLQAGTDIKAALKKLNHESETKPAVLVVLHHTFDPQCVVRDSSRAVHRTNTITVDCLFHEDTGLLQCQRNNESQSTVLDYVNLHVLQDTKRQVQEMRIILKQLRTEKIKHFKEKERLQTETETQLMKRDKQLQEKDRLLTENTQTLQMKDKTLKERDTLLRELKEELGKTNRQLNRVVEELETSKNKVTERDKKLQEKDKQMGTSVFRKKEERNESFFVLLTGNTLKSHQDFIDHLKRQVRLQQVSTVAECDFILVFCPVITQAGTDIEAALKKLNNESETKPAVLVVLHHTFDPECVVPDSSRAVHRTNTITVDCLFYEDAGLLQCHKNTESLFTVLDYINPQERQDKKRQVQEKRVIQNQWRPEFFFSSNIFKETERLQTETETQLMKRDKRLQEIDRLLTKNTQTLQIKDKTLEEKDTLLREVKEELGKTIRQLNRVVEELQELQDERRQLQEMMEQQKTELAEKNKQLQEKEETGGASQFSDKLENMTSETTLETQLQEKERQLEEMRTELKKLKTELAEKNEELKKKESLLPLSEGHLMREHVQDKGKDRHLREMTPDEKKLKEVKAELDNTIQNLEQKKKELQIVSKHLSEEIKVCEINKSELDSMQKKLQEKNKQIQEIIS